MSVPLTDGQLEHIKRLLLNKGAEVNDKLVKLLAGKIVTVEDIIGGKPGETPVERLQRFLGLINRNIKAIRAGTYGCCHFCGAPLEYTSLEEMPWADTCPACASKGS